MVDAFPSNASDSDFPMQLRIDGELHNAQRLRAEFEVACPVDPNDKVNSMVRRMGREPAHAALYPALIQANGQEAWLLPLLRRLAWHDAQQEHIAPWKRMLSEMIQIVVRSVKRVSESEFIALTDLSERCSLRFETRMAAFACELERDGPFSSGVADAVARLRRLADRPESDFFIREGIAWPFFRSPVNPNDPDPCWSARVRGDLEGMEPQLQSNWQKVVTGHGAFLRRFHGSSRRNLSNCSASEVHRDVNERDRILTRVGTGSIPERVGKQVRTPGKSGRARV
jgi:hypothetical protein